MTDAPIPADVAQTATRIADKYLGFEISCQGLYTDVARAIMAHTASLEERVRGLEERDAYQARVHDWVMACFNDEIAFSVTERNHRFLEEAVELVQAQGCTASEAHQLVDYVYGRDVGEPQQEVGGVLVCLAALCTASRIDMGQAGETELARIWTKVEKIRAKHAAKPQFSPLPGNLEAPRPSPPREG